MKTVSEKLGKGFDFKIVHIGLFVNDDLYCCDKWVATIEGQTFDYSTGIGWRKENRLYKNEFKRLKAMNVKRDRDNLNLFIGEFKKVSDPVAPKLDDVLFSLLMDANSGTMLFEDFCNESGMDTDSIKATEIYKQCQSNAIKVRTFINDLDEALTKFDNY